MSSAIGDLDGDSRQDLVMFWPSFGSSAYAVMSNGANYPAFTSVALPPPLYGSNSKANNCAIADLNGDGLGDIVVATTRSEPYYQGAALQLLIQVSPGHFEDQTASRLDNSPSDLSQGEGQLRIFDANGDGLIDIVHSLDSRGANIYFNDGSGHFTLFDLTGFPFVQSSQVEGLQSSWAGGQNQASKLFPVDINSDGLSDFLSYLVLGDNATHAGNIATLYTAISSEQAWGRDQSETLSGTSLRDYIRGYGGNDVLTGRGGDDTLDGGVGIDTAVFTGTRANYTQTKAAAGWKIRSSSEGIDTLANIERIQFSDKKLALDLSPTEHGGQALEFIGLMAPALVTTPSVVGLILGLFDQGKTLQDVCQLALDVGLVRSSAGSDTNAALAAMAFKNIIGSVADAPTVDMLVGFMDGRQASYTQAGFMAMVAGLDVNQTHIDLVGLQQTGVEYV
jgi:hypothetical protein